MSQATNKLDTTNSLVPTVFLSSVIFRQEKNTVTVSPMDWTRRPVSPRLYVLRSLGLHGSFATWRTNTRPGLCCAGSRRRSVTGSVEQPHVCLFTHVSHMCWFVLNRRKQTKPEDSWCQNCCYLRRRTCAVRSDVQPCCHTAISHPAIGHRPFVPGFRRLTNAWFHAFVTSWWGE